MSYTKFFHSRATARACNPRTKSSLKTYQGRRTPEGTLTVTVNNQPIDPRFDLFTYRAKGFDCGFAGRGAAQLSLALLADYAGSLFALQFVDAFMWAVVVKLPPSSNWQLTQTEIDAALALLP